MVSAFLSGTTHDGCGPVDVDRMVGIAARYTRLLSIKGAMPCWRRPSRRVLPINREMKISFCYENPRAA